jgi:hypothetical protein
MSDAKKEMIPFHNVKPGNLFCSNSEEPDLLKWRVYLKLVGDWIVCEDDTGVEKKTVNCVGVSTGILYLFNSESLVSEWDRSN